MVILVLADDCHYKVKSTMVEIQESSQVSFCSGRYIEIEKSMVESMLVDQLLNLWSTLNHSL